VTSNTNNLSNNSNMSNNLSNSGNNSGCKCSNILRVLAALAQAVGNNSS
jgi:hypothetical protein